jgi:hypothetical protein
MAASSFLRNPCRSAKLCGGASPTILCVLAAPPEPSVKAAALSLVIMQQQLIASADESILQILQRHYADLATWLVCFSRAPEPARVPEPHRPDTPSRPHIPPRQPTPSRSQ